MQFFALLVSVLVSICVQVSANPVSSTSAVGGPIPVPTDAVKLDPTTAGNYMISPDQLKHWLATTNAQITHIGPPINALTPQAAGGTVVIYCSDRIDNVCGGPCTVYSGGGICLSAPGTNCLAATKNVGFCSTGDCRGGDQCNQLSTCGIPLDNNFCYTPGTGSILVGAL